jgi:hypothetical protein
MDCWPEDCNEGVDELVADDCKCDDLNQIDFMNLWPTFSWVFKALTWRVGGLHGDVVAVHPIPLRHTCSFQFVVALQHLQSKN